MNMQSRNQYLVELRTEYLKTKLRKKRGELLDGSESTQTEERNLSMLMYSHIHKKQGWIFQGHGPTEKMTTA